MSSVPVVIRVSCDRTQHTRHDACDDVTLFLRTPLPFVSMLCVPAVILGTNNLRDTRGRFMEGNSRRSKSQKSYFSHHYPYSEYTFGEYLHQEQRPQTHMVPGATLESFRVEPLPKVH